MPERPSVCMSDSRVSASFVCIKLDFLLNFTRLCDCYRVASKGCSVCFASSLECSVDGKRYRDGETLQSEDDDSCRRCQCKVSRDSAANLNRRRIWRLFYTLSTAAEGFEIIFPTTGSLFILEEQNILIFVFTDQTWQLQALKNSIDDVLLYLLRITDLLI